MTGFYIEFEGSIAFNRTINKSSPLTRTMTPIL